MNNTIKNEKKLYLKNLMTKKFLLYSVIVLGVLGLYLYASWPAFNYSTWNIDEEKIVVPAVGFLDYDFNPRWFVYHALPMYILSFLYFGMYFAYSLFGLVASKAEFVSFLFSNDAIFYIPAYLLFNLAYISGTLFLAYIISRRFHSKIGAVLFFVMAMLLPDAMDNYIKVENFIYLFLCLTIFYSCFKEKTFFNFFLGVLFCSAAFASKVTAIAFLPVFFAQLLHDIFTKKYPKRYAGYFLVLCPLLVFILMPYTFLDPKGYQTATSHFSEIGSGEYFHVGKAYLFNINDRIVALWSLITRQSGVVAILACFFLAFLSIFKLKNLIFPFIYIGAYCAVFITSMHISGWWLRPVYPFILFFTVIFILNIFQPEFFPVLSKRKLKWPKINANKYAYLQIAMLIVFTFYYIGLHKDNILTSFETRTTAEQDTRIIASKWIQENIPKNASILLDGHIQHYLPRVFSSNKTVTLANFSSTITNHFTNDILLKGFNFYFVDKYYKDNKRFKVYIRSTGPGNISLMENGRYGFYKDTYVVISSMIYDRYFKDVVVTQHPGLCTYLQNYYQLIQSQEHIKTFTGKGPKISIYRVKEDIESLPLPTRKQIFSNLIGAFKRQGDDEGVRAAKQLLKKENGRLPLNFVFKKR